jgi:hypothetical protein
VDPADVALGTGLLKGYPLPPGVFWK